MTTYRNLIQEWRIEGPKEKDGWVCATDWHQTQPEAVKAFKKFLPEIQGRECTMVRRDIFTTIRKVPWNPTGCPKCGKKLS